MDEGWDHAYPEFLEAVREHLPDRAKEPRFGFVVYRLWREHRFDLPDDWRSWIREEFEAVEREFDWDDDVRPSWVRQDLLERTLSVWQRRYPRLMRARHAVEILANVRPLSEAVEVGR